jgi:predicted nuclease of predicted toxin-antitoxin system
VPVEVAHWLAGVGHEAWTAWNANLADGSGAELIAYAHARGAIAVTTNKDFVPAARRQRSARVVFLAVREVDALAMMQRAVEWIENEQFPAGRVLRVRKTTRPSSFLRCPGRAGNGNPQPTF